MSKNNNNFFVKKQIWSDVKDQLLGCYLKPYMQKILTTGKAVYYVDCFAGKGKFDDGNNGSPLIALEIIDSCLKSTNMQAAKVDCCFIDLNYASDLRANLCGYKSVDIISGKYEENINELLSSRRGQNVFLYIDPYGIKALNCNIFDSFSQMNFHSIELLINLNSFGLMREACRVKKIKYQGIEEFNDIKEYDPSDFDTSLQSKQAITDIAGGDYWEKIVDDYNSRQISGYEAEKQLANNYCQRLQEKYRYVLNMPIRLHKGQRPKYRMIHATNHVHGCLLMYENICKRWEVLDNIQSCGQLSMFDMSIDDDIINDNEIAQKLLVKINQNSGYWSLNEIIASFITEYGILCNKNSLINTFQNLETQNKIEIIRQPSKTSTGKDSTFFTENAKQSVRIRCKI